MQEDYDVWDSRALADYFFMETDARDAELPYNIYYREMTAIVAKGHERIKRTLLGNGKVQSEIVFEEHYEVQKFDMVSEQYLTVYETDDPDEMAELCQLFTDAYPIGWWTNYKVFTDLFYAYWDMEEE